MLDKKATGLFVLMKMFYVLAIAWAKVWKANYNDHVPHTDSFQWFWWGAFLKYWMNSVNWFYKSKI